MSRYKAAKSFRYGSRASISFGVLITARRVSLKPGHRCGYRWAAHRSVSAKVNYSTRSTVDDVIFAKKTSLSFEVKITGYMGWKEFLADTCEDLSLEEASRRHPLLTALARLAVGIQSTI